MIFSHCLLTRCHLHMCPLHGCLTSALCKLILGYSPNVDTLKYKLRFGVFGALYGSCIMQSACLRPELGNKLQVHEQCMQLHSDCPPPLWLCCCLWCPGDCRGLQLCHWRPSHQLVRHHTSLIALFTLLITVISTALSAGESGICLPVCECSRGLHG